MSKNIEMTNLKLQADIFGRYFLKKQPNDYAVNLYVSTISATPDSLTAKEQKIIELMVRHPWSIGYFDGGLALISAYSEVRRRLYLTFAILEAQPEYYEYFLPRQRSPFYALFIVLVGLRAIIRAILGTIFLKLWI